MLTELYRKSGLPLKEHFGVPYPEFFVHPAAEYVAQVTYCGVIDLMHWRILRVTGKDRVTFLNAMLTNDIAALEKDEGTHSMITTIKGKIIAELFVFVREDDVLVLVAQGDAAQTQEVLEKHIVMEDVDDGPIIVQKPCPIDPDDTPDSLKTKVQALEREAFIEAIKMFQEGKISVGSTKIPSREGI